MDGTKCLTFLLLCVINFLPCIAFAAYESNSAFAAQWLSSQQNNDGSWGATEPQQFLLTVEAVQALWAVGQHNRAYFEGITWLENHVATNADYQARRAIALNSHGDDVTSPVAALESAQNIALPGHSAWGVSDIYHQTPLDTALVLNSLTSVGTSADIQSAINYLKSTQLTGTDQGWSIATQTNSDPFVTAMVVKTLVSLQSQDVTLSIAIANALATLNTRVTLSSPTYLQGHAAHAALLAGDTVTAKPWLDNLVASQLVDGSWGGKTYGTALAMRAFATADGQDSLTNQTPIIMLNDNLRAAVNAALGHNAMDSLDCAELSYLKTLTAINLSIDDLTGLECAINLTTLDLRNNNIISTAPIDGLTQLTTLLLDGNPVSGDGTSSVAIDEEIPTLPEWGLILMALLLMGIGVQQQRRNNNFQLTA